MSVSGLSEVVIVRMERSTVTVCSVPLLEKRGVVVAVVGEDWESEG